MHLKVAMKMRKLKDTPYMYGICLAMQHLHNLRRHSKNLGPLSTMASKSEVISRDSLLVLLNLRLQVRCRVHWRLHQSQSGIVKLMWKKRGQVLELLAVGEQGILQVRAGFGVTVSEVEGTLAATEEAMAAGPNSESRVSFRDDPKFQADGTETTISGLIRMEGVAAIKFKQRE